LSTVPCSVPEDAARFTTETYPKGEIMWETRTVQIAIQLPHDIADQAEEVQKADPDFLSRVVLYGLTRRSIYHQLRDRNGPSYTEHDPIGEIKT